MFDNIGSKLKTLAKIECWAGIILSVIGALVIWFGYGNGGFLTGLLTLLSGCAASWIGSWITYGVGEGVENTEILRAELADLRKRLNSAQEAGAGSASHASAAFPGRGAPVSRTVPKRDCPHCGARNNPENTTCFACGQSLGSAPGSVYAYSRSSSGAPASQRSSKKKCPECGGMNNPSNTTCFACGHSFGDEAGS